MDKTFMPFVLICNIAELCQHKNVYFRNIIYYHDEIQFKNKKSPK